MYLARSSSDGPVDVKYNCAWRQERDKTIQPDPLDNEIAAALFVEVIGMLFIEGGDVIGVLIHRRDSTALPGDRNGGNPEGGNSNGETLVGGFRSSPVTHTVRREGRKMALRNSL